MRDLGDSFLNCSIETNFKDKYIDITINNKVHRLHEPVCLLDYSHFEVEYKKYSLKTIDILYQLHVAIF